MYTTCNNRLIERQLDREVEEVGTGRCIQHVTIDRQRDTQIERCIKHVTVDRQRDTLIKRCKQHTTKDRQRDSQIERCIQRARIDRQRDTQIERWKRQVQVTVYNIQQQIDREIVRQRDLYNMQIEEILDRKVQEVDTGRCIQHVTID